MTNRNHRPRAAVTICLVGICLALAITPRVRAQDWAPLMEYPGRPYVSGHELRAQYQALIAYEGGVLVDVPLDYDHPQRGTTQIYAYFARPFNPRLPTYAIFLGGPGQHCHRHFAQQFEFFASLSFNFLLFDSRGVGFSRMETESLARDARNFSAEQSPLQYLHTFFPSGLDPSFYKV